MQIHVKPLNMIGFSCLSIGRLSAPPAPGEASGTVPAGSFTAMRKVVEFKETGMCVLANTCGLDMALKAMADFA